MLAIDRLIVPMDEAYPVGDPPLMYPHAGVQTEDVLTAGVCPFAASEADYQAQRNERRNHHHTAAGKRALIQRQEHAAGIAAGD